MRTTTVRAAALLGTALIVMRAGPPSSPQPTPPAPDAESVKLIGSIQGPELYRQYCAVCHGLDGKGNGPLAPSLRTRPGDLTGISARNHGDFPQARVERIISGEVPLPGGHGTREMPLWGPIFSQIAWDQDLGRVRVNNLARYIRQIQAK